MEVRLKSGARPTMYKKVLLIKNALHETALD